MAQYIKKVAVTPVRGNGFIIDSFNTNDNKNMNAPSINAVQERTDNNILFGADFAAYSADIAGWSSVKMQGYVGAPITFAPIMGAIVPPNYDGQIKSPMMCDYNGKGGERSAPFSCTIGYKTTGDISVEPSIAKIENFDENGKDGEVENLLELHAFIGGAFFFVNIKNLSSSNVYITYIKLERGTSSTPFYQVGKDAAIEVQIQSTNNNMKNLLYVKRYQQNGITVPIIGYSNNIELNESGYTPLGIVSFDASADLCFRECRIRITGDHVDYFLNNLSDDTKTNCTIFVDVLFIKSGFGTIDR